MLVMRRRQGSHLEGGEPSQVKKAGNVILLLLLSTEREIESLFPFVHHRVFRATNALSLPIYYRVYRTIILKLD